MKRILPVLLVALLVPGAILLLGRGGGDPEPIAIGPGAELEPAPSAARDAPEPARSEDPAIPAVVSVERRSEVPVIHGRLVDAAEGRPLARWPIHCREDDKHCRVAVTDPEGRFAMLPRPGERVELEIRVEQWRWVRPEGATLTAAQAKGLESVTLRLPAAPITGRLVAEGSGRIVPEVRLLLRRPWGREERVDVDSEGRFVTRGLWAEGAVRARSELEGLLSVPDPPTHRPGSSEPLELRASVGPIIPLALVAPPEVEIAAIEGRLQERQGAPDDFRSVRSAFRGGSSEWRSVRESLEPPLLWFPEDAWTDAFGKGERAVVRRRLEVRTSDGAWVGLAAVRAVQGLQDEPVEVRLLPAGDLDGIVLDEAGEPVSPVFLVLAIPPGRDIPASGFRIPPRLDAAPPVWIPPSSIDGPASVDEERRRQLLLPGVPPHASLALPYILASPVVRSEADGRFRFEHVFPRPYVLLAFPRRGRPHAVDVKIPEGAGTSLTVALGSVETPPLGRVHGTVIGRGLGPIPDPVVLLTRKGLERGAEDWLLRKSEHVMQHVALEPHEGGLRGEFFFTNLPVAKYRVEILHESPFTWDNLEWAVTAPAGPLEFVCHNDVPCEQIRVTARRAGGGKLGDPCWMVISGGSIPGAIRRYGFGDSGIEAILPHGSPFLARVGCPGHRETILHRADFEETDGILEASIVLEPRK